MSIFGTAKRGSKTYIDWSSLLSLLEDDDQRAAVERVYPNEGRESFLSALRRFDARDSTTTLAAEVLSAGRQFHTAEQLVDWPTVAVAGMLNSGKTSLVATFLSEQGRARTLRGSSNREGTHRFVLWLPSQWESDAELWGLLMQRIGDSIGVTPEMLSLDPAVAHQQYNNHDGNAELLSVPLVATDDRLNQIGLGLLDCPDIVSDEAFGLGSPQDRRAVLSRAATLCSAFLVVTSAESSRDAALGDLLRIASDLMPGIPRMLAVNKIRPRQTPDQVFETFDPLARTHGIETIYAAYDFEIPSSRPFIPAPDDVVARALDPESDSLPVFFSLRAATEENPPAAIESSRMLQAMPARLDRGVLFETFRYSLEENLYRVVWEDAYRELEKDAARSEKQTFEGQRCLLNAALDFFAHRGLGSEITELRLHQSERIIRQLTESFAITAPWYARWGVRLNAKMRNFFGGAGNLLRSLTPTAIAERTAGDIKDKFKRGEYGGLLTPQKLTLAIDRHGGATKLPHWPDLSSPSVTAESKEMWNDAAEAAILRFERDDFTSLDPRRLDEAVRQMWEEVPRGKKLLVGLTPLGALLAAFGGVLTLPVDFGSTLIASASMSELFIAGGLTTFATMWAGKQNTRNVEQQAARQQVADFQAVLCDTFGVARVEVPETIKVGGVSVKLPIPKIAARASNHATLPLHRMRDDFRKSLRDHFPNQKR
ncbi:hypothetical protein N9N28_01255 [Rubripirellula amarantea]|nr:hypothetical protein [Rubripirellula amarantea]